MFCQAYIAGTNSNPPRNIGESQWSLAHKGYFKCNIDAAVQREGGVIGWDLCVKDESSAFVIAKTEWVDQALQVNER